MSTPDDTRPGPASEASPRTSTRSWLLLAGVTAVACAATFLLKGWLLDRADSRAESVRVSMRAERASEVRSRGRMLERRLVNAVRDLRASSAKGVSAELACAADADVWFERTDAEGRVRAFSGRPLSAAPGEGWIILQRPPFTLLALRSAVARDGTRLTVAAPLDIALPSGNRFVRDESFLTQLEEVWDTPLELVADTTTVRPQDAEVYPLEAGGHVLARILAAPVDPARRRAELSALSDTVLGFLLLGLCVFLGVPVTRAALRLRPLAAGVILTLYVGAVRALLLVAGTATALLPDWFQDRRLYASALAWGAASSPGEFVVSLLLLALLALLLLRVTTRARQPQSSAADATAAFRAAAPPARTSAAVALATLGIAASIAVQTHAVLTQSLIRDSPVNADHIAGLLSDPLQAWMIGTAWLASFALGVFTLAALRAAGRLASDRGILFRVFLPAIGYAAATLVFRLWSLDTGLPLPMAAGWGLVVCASGFLPPGTADRLTGRRVAPFAAAWIAATLLTLPLLATHTDVKRGESIEALGVAVSRPVDGWSQVLLEQTLDHLQRQQPVLSRRADGGVDARTAFNLWDSSPLSRMQNNAAVAVFDTAGLLRSRFAVGDDPFLLAMAAQNPAPRRTEGIVQRTSRDRETGEVRYYTGYTDLRAADGTALVAAVILQGLDALQLARPSGDLLRGLPADAGAAPEDRLIVTRFRNGALVQTTDRSFPHSLPLPDDVRRRLKSEGLPLWSTLEVDGTALDTWFVPDPDRPDDVIAISKGHGPAALRLYRFLRLAWIFLGLSIVALLATRLHRLRLRTLKNTSFARRLQFAFLTVAALPLLLLWVAGRQFVAESERRSAERRIGDQLDATAASLPMLRAGIAPLTDSLCIDLRGRTGHDFSVYAPSDIAATSRPEWYRTGLLNTRMHPAAYIAVVLQGRDLSFTTETIGDNAYIVGYRALRSERGTLAAVLSTALLREGGRTERVYLDATAGLFLWLNAMALLVVLISGAFARQISRPVRALLHATRDVAAGDLERRVQAEGPAEFTELMAAFNLMTLRLRRSAEELAAAQRDLAWKEMARQVAHEIRNPLTPMKLAAQHLQRAWSDGAANIGSIIERLTATIIDQVDTLSRISDEFARFARMPRRAVEAVDVEAALEESVRLFRHHDHVSITLHVAAPLPRVDADREELGRAVTNILRNAVQAVHERGHIHVEAAGRGGTLQVRISDDGVGIPAELLDRIFEPNFSTRTEGMGLGLAIVRTIVRDAGGDVTIESTPGRGTTVTLLLPARVEP